MSDYQEWRKQKLQARLLATGESDTSDLTEKNYKKEMDNNSIVMNIKCNLCGNILPPHTVEEHLDKNNFIHKCPHLKIKILDVQRTPKRKTIKSIVIETENFYRRIEKDSDFTNMNFNWEELKELANQSTTP